MTGQAVFSSAGFALLRAPAGAARQAAGGGLEAAALEQPARLAGYLRELAADATFREAVAVSSPPLDRRWTEILDGKREAGLAELRRAVRSLTAYQLRMATRSTPFGLMAGVAVAEIGRDAEAKVRWGTAHQRTARPERDWLAALIRDWERRPEVLTHLRVAVNNLCFARAGRVVLPYVPNNPDDDQVKSQVQEVSVRNTAAVQAAVQRARVPVRYTDLRLELARLWPEVSEEAVTRLLGRLLDTEILLTDLRPPCDEADPLAWVAARLSASGIPELAGLEAIAAGLRDYAAQPLGAGGPAWTAVTTAMGRLHPRDRLVHVDLALDVEVRLPSEVAAEAERAADLLWRLAPAPPASSPLREYHAEFLNRYGLDCMVPVKELLDPDTGLGPPAGYTQPEGHRPAPTAAHRDPVRNRLLLRLAQEAVVSGDREVVLDDEHPLIAQPAREDIPPSAGAELFTQLVADSPAALGNGDFRLIVLAAADTPGASAGRFAYLLPERVTEALSGLAAAAARAPGSLGVQVVFQSRQGRGDNVAQAPRVLARQLPVGVFAHADAGDVVDLDDVAVSADGDRFFFQRLRDGAEIVPVVAHLLNQHALAPNVVRFLSEAACWPAGGLRPWDWGAASDLPYTPRVRYGRVVLATARWRPPDALREEQAPFTDWLARFEQWRQRWGVPGRTCLTAGDQRIEMLLTEPLHLWLLRHELARDPHAVLAEVPGPADADGGWLSGPDGGHRNELVFPLISRQPAAPGGQAGARPARTRHETIEHLPGGDWLYVAVRCAFPRQEELLSAHLPRLIAALPAPVDRWFFVRYPSPDHHVRLRFHGASWVLRDQVLPGVHAWAADLRAHGLIQGMSLETYAPETCRYGGRAAIEAAERAFCADSDAVLATLAQAGTLELEPVLLAAASYVDLARAFFPPASQRADGQPPWADWFLRAFPKSARHTEFQRRRRDAIDLIDVDGDWPGLRGRQAGAELLTAWAGRTPAVASYGTILHELGGPELAARVLPSLFHMHHNRLIGTSQDSETSSLAIARGVIEAYRNRKRNYR